MFDLAPIGLMHAEISQQLHTERVRVSVEDLHGCHRHNVGHGVHLIGDFLRVQFGATAIFREFRTARHPVAGQTYQIIERPGIDGHSLIRSMHKHGFETPVVIGAGGTELTQHVPQGMECLIQITRHRVLAVEYRYGLCNATIASFRSMVRLTEIDGAIGRRAAHIHDVDLEQSWPALQQ